MRDGTALRPIFLKNEFFQVGITNFRYRYPVQEKILILVKEPFRWIITRCRLGEPPVSKRDTPT